MHSEDLLIDDSGDGQTVEAVGKGLPQLDVVPTLALIVETIDTVDGGALVVASQDEEVLGVLDLVGQEEADGFEGLLSTVDVVTEEEVVGLGREATVLEEAQQVVILPVDIAANLCTGRGHLVNRARTNGATRARAKVYLDGSLELQKDGL
jgi:hypothetical protein